MDGWMASTEEAQSIADLPDQASKYLTYLEECVGAEISLVSIGPQRRRSIVKEDVWSLAGRS